VGAPLSNLVAALHQRCLMAYSRTGESSKREGDRHPYMTPFDTFEVGRQEAMPMSSMGATHLAKRQGGGSGCRAVAEARAAIERVKQQLAAARRAGPERT
jgi:crotonobetainyl-CoA:carnitine CoA-transferase CaiB-like acyl-CoA transferase